MGQLFGCLRISKARDVILDFLGYWDRFCLDPTRLVALHGLERLHGIHFWGKESRVLGPVGERNRATY